MNIYAAVYAITVCFYQPKISGPKNPRAGACLTHPTQISPMDMAGWGGG